MPALVITMSREQIVLAEVEKSIAEFGELDISPALEKVDKFILTMSTRLLRLDAEVRKFLLKGYPPPELNAYLERLVSHQKRMEELEIRLIRLPLWYRQALYLYTRKVNQGFLWMQISTCYGYIEGEFKALEQRILF